MSGQCHAWRASHQDVLWRATRSKTVVLPTAAFRGQRRNCQLVVPPSGGLPVLLRNRLKAELRTTIVDTFASEPTRAAAISSRTCARRFPARAGQATQDAT